MKQHRDNGIVFALGAVGLLGAIGLVKSRGSENDDYNDGEPYVEVGFDKERGTWQSWIEVPYGLAGYGLYSETEYHENKREAKAAMERSVDWMKSIGVAYRVV